MVKKNKKNKISVVGLGYVGLPLALELSKFDLVIGYDLNKRRVKDLNNNLDMTEEISELRLRLRKNLTFTSDISFMDQSDYFIITVPTPVSKKNEPDLSILKKAAYTVGSVMSKGSIVIIESTVYPGVTEDIIAKVLEKSSGLSYLKDFNLAYSPERINPGDSKFKLNNIKKIVAADQEKILNKVFLLYKKIIKAGVFKASSIKVAETSKAIENAQRDINIAFINEVAMISKAVGVSAREVLRAAKTKWNFLNFEPGLVGGHCIGVDPYYLAKAAKIAGHKPEIILAGRKINDQMPSYIFNEINSIIKRKSRILMLGLTFKEDVKDIRNSKSAELYYKFYNKSYDIELYDPIADEKDAFEQFKIKLVKPRGKYDCIILSVGHKVFKKMTSLDIMQITKNKCLIVDVKNVWPNKKLPKNVKKWSL